MSKTGYNYVEAVEGFGTLRCVLHCYTSLCAKSQGLEALTLGVWGPPPAGFLQNSNRVFIVFKCLILYNRRAGDRGV